MFLGAGGALFSLSSHTVSDSNFAAASAGYYLKANGRAQQSTTVGGGPFDFSAAEWATGFFNAGDYEALVTVTSGTMTSGTTGSAVNLGSDQTWLVTQIGAGSKSCTFNVTIRFSGGGATVASSTGNVLSATAS